MLGFVFYNNVLYGLGVFFTLLRKPQFSYKMKFCFEIQIENSSPLLKFFSFFFFFHLVWQSKVFMKLNSNSQSSPQRILTWVNYLSVLYNSALFTYDTMPTRSSLWLKQHISLTSFNHFLSLKSSEEEKLENFILTKRGFTVVDERWN